MPFNSHCYSIFGSLCRYRGTDCVTHKTIKLPGELCCFVRFVCFFSDDAGVMTLPLDVTPVERPHIWAKAFRASDWTSEYPSVNK